MANKRTAPITVAGKAPDHVFIVDTLYPSDEAAIARLKRGDTVPPEDVAWVLVKAGQTCRKADFDPWIWQSLVSNSALAPLAEHSPQPVSPVFPAAQAPDEPEEDTVGEPGEPGEFDEFDEEEV